MQSQGFCENLNTCNADALQDVFYASAPTNGQALIWNSAFGRWIPTTLSSGSAFQCSDLNTCSINELLDVLSSAPQNGQTLVWNSAQQRYVNQQPFTSFFVSDGINTQQVFNGTPVTFVASGLGLSVAVSNPDTVTYTLNICAGLPNCSIGQLGNVSSTDPSVGQVLQWNGSLWAPTTITGSGFSCVDLNGCTLDSMGDVLYSSAPTNGQALIWNSVFSQWIPTTPFSSFSITDNTNSQTITNGNTLRFLASGLGLTALVSATDTVTYTLNVCAALPNCSIGQLGNVSSTDPSVGQVLQWNGSNWAPATITPSGFSCTDLNSCTLDAMGDVLYASAPTNGQALIWNTAFNQWIPSTPFSSFSITDNTNSQTITNGNTLRFLASGLGLTALVSATDTVTYTLNVCAGLPNCTISQLGDVSSTAPVSGQVLTWNGSLWAPATVSGSGFTCVSLSSCPLDAMSDVLYASAPTNGQALMWNSAFGQWIPTTPFSSFTMTDGLVSQVITNGNTLTILGGGNTSIAVSATDTLTITTEVCSALANCTIGQLGNVSSTSPALNQVLQWNGSLWAPGTISGSGFTCASLNSCSINDLLDVLSSSPQNGQTLIWNSAQQQYVNQQPFTSWFMSDGSNTQQITNGNTMTIVGGGNTTVAVSAIDTLTITTNVCAALAGCTIGQLGNVSATAATTGQALVWNGSLWAPATIGGGSFSCTDLNSCTIGQLSNVSSGAASAGNVLTWNGTLWIPAAPASGFTCTDLNSCPIGSLSNVSSTAATNGQVLTWNGSLWAPATPSAGGATHVGSTCVSVLTVGSTVTTDIIIKPGVTQLMRVSDSAPQDFANNLTCIAGGLYTPCTEIREYTKATPTDPDYWRFDVPCLENQNLRYSTYLVPSVYQIQRSGGFGSDVAPGDPWPGGLGVILWLNSDGSLFFNDGSSAQPVT